MDITVTITVEHEAGDTNAESARAWLAREIHCLTGLEVPCAHPAAPTTDYEVTAIAFTEPTAQSTTV